MISTLLNLTGNPRGCVYTEPLWGIPYFLFFPYVSVYMVALGLTDKQIGTVISIGLACQIVWSLLSGVITDKMGRRLTTLVFDILAWTIPSLIWAVSQNFWYFVLAAIVNSTWRVPMNSWSCLMVEDADPDQLVDIYSLVYISGQLAAFFAPLAGILINVFTLVPTMRGLYLFAAVMFTVKCIATYRMTQETRQGLVRLHETKHQSAVTILTEYKGVVQELLRAPQTLYTAGIMLIISICSTISNGFWALIVTEKIHVPAQDLAYFPFVRSGLLLLFFFILTPRLGRLHFRIPLVVGFAGYIVSQLVLITIPEKNYLLLLLNIVLEACSLAAVNPLVDRMTVLTVDPKERARILAILYVVVLLFTSPFGWIAGTLSDLDKNLPFMLNIALFAMGGLLAYLAGQLSQKKPVAATVTTEVSAP